MTAQDVHELNKAEIREFTTSVPAHQEGWSLSAPKSQLIDVLNSVKRNPVVSPAYGARYDSRKVGIGYCFGRAAYVHFALLKMGLQPQSIKKIWAVGPIDSGGEIKWDFHVATVAYSTEQGWLVIDNDLDEVTSVRKWTKQIKAGSADQKLRFYITDAEKFSVDLGAYSFLQMGLKLPWFEDVYGHYFVDMIQSLETSTLADLGLAKIAGSGPAPDERWKNHLPKE